MDRLTLFIVLQLYVYATAFYGLYHASVISKKLQVLALRERALRERVSIHELTPVGAEYFNELQELYLTHAEALHDLKHYQKKPIRYLFPHFVFAMIFWPYFVFSTRRHAAARHKKTTRG